MQRALQKIRSIQSRALGPLTGTITRVKTKQPAIAITFDDGPHPQYTPQVLELLKQHNAHATFFIVGQFAKQHPDIIQRIRQEGHALANHTYNHLAMPSLNSRQRRQEVRDCAKLLEPQNNRLFRPPWGQQTRASRFDLLRLRHRVVTWDIILDDWIKQEPQQLADRITTEARPGSIILLHDAIRPAPHSNNSCTDRQFMIQALDIALPKLTQQLQCVTLPKLLTLGQPVYRNWIYNP